MALTLITQQFADATFARLQADMAAWSERLGIQHPNIELHVAERNDSVTALSIRTDAGVVRRIWIGEDNLQRLQNGTITYDELAAIVSHAYAHHALGHAIPYQDLTDWQRTVRQFDTASQRTREFQADELAAALTNRDDLLSVARAARNESFDLSATDFATNFLGLGIATGHVSLDQRTERLNDGTPELPPDLRSRLRLGRAP